MFYKMKEIKIQFDYLHGPLWKEKLDVKTGEWSTGIPCIDEDKAIQLLNDEAEKMYGSLFLFNDGTDGCRFDEDRFIQIKPELLSIVQTIIDRLSLINDGTYVVIDKATEVLK